jgi:hypothetical protein
LARREESPAKSQEGCRNDGDYDAKPRNLFKDSMADDLVQLELTLNRFRRLLRELDRGMLARHTFCPREIELILDFQQCPLPVRRRTEILCRYERAVARLMETGPGPPMKFSEFLDWCQGLKPAASVDALSQ